MVLIVSRSVADARLQPQRDTSYHCPVMLLREVNLMDFLKKLLGGGSDHDARGMYVYVIPKRCDDVLRVRIDMSNDLSQRDDASGYWVRKLASSSNYKCNQVELTLYFDSNRRLVDQEIEGGKLVDKAAYEAWVETQKPT